MFVQSVVPPKGAGCWELSAAISALNLHLWVVDSLFLNEGKAFLFNDKFLTI